MLLMSNPLSVMVFSVLEGMYSFPRLVVQFMLLGQAFPVLYMWLKKKKAWACKTLFIKIKMRVCMEFLVTSLWGIGSSLWTVGLFVQGLPTWALCMSCSVKLEFKNKEQCQAICRRNVGLQARLLSRTPGFCSILLPEKWVSSSAPSIFCHRRELQ